MRDFFFNDLVYPEIRKVWHMTAEHKANLNIVTQFMLLLWEWGPVNTCRLPFGQKPR